MVVQTALTVCQLGLDGAEPLTPLKLRNTFQVIEYHIISG